MGIEFDGHKTLTIHGIKHNVDDICAFDIANINDYNHVRLIKKNEEIVLHKSWDVEDCIKHLMVIKRQVRKLNCKQFELLDYVIVNMDKIQYVGQTKHAILIEFDARSFTKEVDIASKTAFIKTFDRYLASNMSNTLN